MKKEYYLFYTISKLSCSILSKLHLKNENKISDLLPHQLEDIQSSVLSLVCKNPTHSS